MDNRGGNRGRGRGHRGGRGAGDRRPRYSEQPRDGGAGRGRPDPQAWAPRTPAPAPPTPPSVPRGSTEDVHKPRKEASSSNPSENEGKIIPVRRPDKGGTLAVRQVRLLVNHFPIKFNPANRIRHYDVDIKPDAPPKNGRPVRISKLLLSLIREKLFSDNPEEFPLSMTAYDGEKNIFSAVPLPTGKFTVKLSHGDGERERSFTCTITLVNELYFSKLKDYLAGNLLSIPRDVLQGMDLVMKENPARNMFSFGRSFYPVDSYKQDDLGRGIAAHRGFQHSAKSTAQGTALCLDYSVLAFRKRMPVLDFLAEHIPGFTIGNFGRYRLEAEKALKGLKVTVTHRRSKQKYSITRFTEKNTRQLSFEAEEAGGQTPARQVTLLDYFRQKYMMEIKYKDIPCLDLGKGNRKNYVPMEVCVLAEGQRYPKESLDMNAARMLKNMSLVQPKDRQRQILEMVQANDGPCGGDICKNFGIDVDMDMTKVVGRVIDPPGLKVGGSNGMPIRIPVDKEKRQWNLVGKLVPEGKTIERWAVLDFSSSDRFRLQPDRFIPKLIGRCRSLGIRMEEPLIYQCSSMDMFSNAGKLLDILEWANQEGHKRGKGQLQFILCVMAKKHNGYKCLKWVSETKVGVVTQCCLSKNANDANDQYLANLALKINAKLGGSNVELFDRFPHFEGSRVMFIGADVNHPAALNSTSPSIAAVVGTVNWPAANRYAARVRPQSHRQEEIVNFGDMCLELVNTYARVNGGVRPEKIVLVRDGVSESQFDMVLNVELQDIKKTFSGNNYKPSITLIVAQKRHQTRLFPEREVDGCRTGNVPPGTVVDTRIVHPFDFDFYLCSHYGGLGTSKPTHYYVLWDEHKFTSDLLEELIYYLCFTFARCTKPVSLVTPVYYADLAAYRGRLYHEALIEEQSPSSRSSSSSSGAYTSLSSVGSFEERFYKLHGALENGMFFI